MRAGGGHLLVDLAAAVAGALFGPLIMRFSLPAIFESGTLFIALVFSLPALGLILTIRVFRRSGGSL